MALFDEESSQPDSGSGGSLGWFQQKLGPLPMWSWIAVGVVGYLLYSRYKASKKSASASTSGADSGVNQLGANTQTGEDIIVTQPEPGATTIVNSTPASSIPAGNILLPVATLSGSNQKDYLLGLQHSFTRLVNNTPPGAVQNWEKTQAGPYYEKPGWKEPQHTDTGIYNVAGQNAVQQALAAAEASGNTDAINFINQYMAQWNIPPGVTALPAGVRTAA